MATAKRKTEAREVNLGESVDPKLVEKWKKEAKAQGARVVEQGPILKWADQDIGFELVGDFVAIREGRSQPGSDMKPGYLLDIVSSEDGEVETWGCPAILKDRLERAQVVKGDSIRILLVGKVASKVKGRQPAWNFELAHYPKGAEQF